MVDGASMWRRTILAGLLATGLAATCAAWGKAPQVEVNVFTLSGTSFAIGRDAFDPPGIEVSGRQDAVLLILDKADLSGPPDRARPAIDVARIGWGDRVQVLLRPVGTKAGSSQAFLARVLASVVDPSSDALPRLQLRADAAREHDPGWPGLPIVLNPPARLEGGFAELRRSRDIFLDGRPDAIGTVLWCLKPRPDNNPTCQMTFVVDAVAYQLD